MEQVGKFLAKLPIFSSFSPTELNQLIEKSHLKIFEPGEFIIQFGQPGRFLGVMLEGEAEAVIISKTGHSQRLGLIKEGDVLGEMSLLTGEPTMADVVALKKCFLFLMSQETFLVFVAVNSTAVKVLAKIITDRLKNRQQNEEEQSRVLSAWWSSADPYGLEMSHIDPQKILIINCKSSSLKYSYFDTAKRSKNLIGEVETETGANSYKEALKTVISLISDPDKGVITHLNELCAVGHRVVHGGEKYSNAVIIDDKVIKDIDNYAKLAPLFNPPSLIAIKECIKLMPTVPQVAVFDTGFHQKMPSHAYLYGIPYDLYTKDNIRRFGFQGISHNYVALQASAYLKRNYREVKIVSCHLGPESSLCAIDHGRSVDTSMGLTPLEGLIMGTRSGDLDPSVISYLCKEKGLTIAEVDEILQYQSGLKGLSGISSDLCKIEKAANNGDRRALLTMQVFCYRIRKYIGAYIAALGGLDVLLFTGNIGESSAWVRGLACQGLSYMGIRVDEILNKSVTSNPGTTKEISHVHSQVKVLVIPTDEEKMIARDTLRTLGRQSVTQVIKKQKERKFPIEVSAHHIHLSKEDKYALFGEGSDLTFRSELSQPGQFACNETVNLIGPKGRVERVRVLGPERKETQVEISMTEEFKLGVKAPIRASGDLDGSPGIALEGTKATKKITKGVICSFRHIHMSPEDALTFGVKDRDIVLVKVKGERTLIFGDVLVRVHPDFLLSMHIDTDEANAANITTGMEGILVDVQDRR